MRTASLLLIRNNNYSRNAFCFKIPPEESIPERVPERIAKDVRCGKWREVGESLFEAEEEL